MFTGTRYVGQNILWQTRATRQMLVNTGGREYTQCDSCRHGLRFAPYANCRALERAAEQEDKDQALYRVLDGLLVLRG